MFSLLLLGVVGMISFGVTVFAVATAKDGYEDRWGFHATTRGTAEKGSIERSPSRAPVTDTSCAGVS